MRFPLVTRNAHPRDRRIQFDEPSHVQTVDGRRESTSVTTFMHRFFPPFDRDAIIERMLSGKRWDTDPTQKYQRKSKDDILRMWRDATTQGTQLHQKIECHCNGNEVSWEGPEWEQQLQFRRDQPYLEPYRTEWFVFEEELKLAGSIDAVFKDTRDDTLVIIDWKRNAGLEADDWAKEPRFLWEEGTLPLDNSPFTERAYPPISTIHATKFWQHSCQINMYWQILNTKQGLPVKEAQLLAVHPEYDRQHMIKVPYLRLEMLRLAEHRLAEVYASMYGPATLKQAPGGARSRRVPSPEPETPAVPATPVAFPFRNTNVKPSPKPEKPKPTAQSLFRMPANVPEKPVD